MGRYYCVQAARGLATVIDTVPRSQITLMKKFDVEYFVQLNTQHVIIDPGSFQNKPISLATALSLSSDRLMRTMLSR